MANLNIEDYVPVVQWDGLNTDKAVNFAGAPSVALPLSTTVGGSPISGGGGGVLVYNVKTYGAVGDGTTDDTTAINNAIVAAAITKGVVYAPTGTYKVASGATSITPMNNVSLIGDGMGRTIFLPYNLRSAIRLAGSTITPLTDVTFQDFTIDGTNQSGTYASSIKGTFITYMLRVKFINIEVKNTGATGMGNDFHQDCVYQNCITDNTGRLGTGSSPGSAGIGIGTSSWCTGANFVDCVTKNSKRCGIFFETQDTTYATGYQVVNHTSTGNGEYGLADAGCDGLRVIGGVFSGNTISGIGTYGGTLGNSYLGKNALFLGCRLTGNTSCGYTLAAPTTATNGGGGNVLMGCLVEGNTLDGISLTHSSNTGSDLYNIAVRNCDIRANGRAGIYINGNTAGSIYQYLKITGNRISNSSAGGSAARPAGIYQAGNVANLQISDNTIWDDQGTKTQEYAYNKFSGGLTGNSFIANNDFRGNNTAALTMASLGAGLFMSNNQGANIEKAKSSAYTVSLVDQGNLISVTGNTTITLLTAVGNSGFRITVKKVDTAGTTTTIDTTSSQTIDGATAQTITAQWSSYTFESNGTSWRIIGKV